MAEIASKNIKGITIEINGDVTKLDKALSQVDKDLAATQKNLKEVDKLLKLDPKNVELLDQKQRLLAQGVELTSKRYDTLKKAVDGATPDNAKYQEWENAQKSLSEEIKRTETSISELTKQQKNMKELGFPADGSEMKEIQQEIDKAKGKIEDLNKEAKNTYESLGRPISTDQYDALQRELVQTKADMDNAAKAAENFESGAEDIGDSAENTSGIIGKLNEALGGSGGGMVLAAAAGAAAIDLAAKAIKALADWTKEAVEQSAKFADEMNTLSQQTGFSTDFLQGIDYAAGLVDVSADSIISAMKKLKMNLASDSEGVKEAFDRIGIIPEQLAASGSSMEEIFGAVVSALSGVHDELERDQIAMSIFGKGADELAGVIDDGGQSLWEYIDAAKEAGYIMSGEELDALSAVDDQFYKLDKAMEMAKKRIAIELSPEIINLTQQLLDLIESTDWSEFGARMADVIHDLTPMIIEMATAIRDTAQAITGLLTMINKLKTAKSNDGIITRNDGTLRTPVRGYASGGVFEPNNPMLIGIGDNRTEREVVTPESLMRRVVREESGSGYGEIKIVAQYSGTDDGLIRMLAPKLRVYNQQLGEML